MLKLALMDLNNGKPNQGMRGLREILKQFVDEIDTQEFEVRQKGQVPNLDFDIYLSSGGPGDPRKGDQIWENDWHQLIADIWQHNQTPAQKKYLFLICHSFQMACEHFGLCKITLRKAASFGIYPIHKTPAGRNDILLEELKDPFFGVDSREWQLVTPQKSVFEEMGAKIIALEKIRTHVEYERAIMAIRFSPYMVGTQFHPEADPKGMLRHFNMPENRDKVIRNFSPEKYRKMMLYLQDPATIAHTYQQVIPGFLRRAVESLKTDNYAPSG